MNTTPHFPKTKAQKKSWDDKDQSIFPPGNQRTLNLDDLYELEEKHSPADSVARLRREWELEHQKPDGTQPHHLLACS